MTDTAPSPYSHVAATKTFRKELDETLQKL